MEIYVAFFSLSVFYSFSQLRWRQEEAIDFIQNSPSSLSRHNWKDLDQSSSMHLPSLFWPTAKFSVSAAPGWILCSPRLPRAGWSRFLSTLRNRFMELELEKADNVRHQVPRLHFSINVDEHFQHIKAIWNFERAASLHFALKNFFRALLLAILNESYYLGIKRGVLLKCETLNRLDLENTLGRGFMVLRCTDFRPNLAGSDFCCMPQRRVYLPWQAKVLEVTARLRFTARSRRIVSGIENRRSRINQLPR